MKDLYQRWKKVAEKIGNFQASVIFSALYFIIFSPIALISRPFTDFLATSQKPSWNKIKNNSDTIDSLREQ